MTVRDANPFYRVRHYPFVDECGGHDGMILSQRRHAGQSTLTIRVHAHDSRVLPRLKQGRIFGPLVRYTCKLE